MLRPIDYDQQQHLGYARGRALHPAARKAWAAAFAAQAPATRPLTCLDLGSGTGRFTPLLAEIFGGPAIGVEPSQKMRAVAERTNHPATVTYLPGSGEAIPVQDSSIDLVLMFLSFHHVRDRVAAATEIARVLAPGGRVFIRSGFSDRMPSIHWHRFFPSARAVELSMFPSVSETVAVFEPAGLRPLALDCVYEVFADNLTEHAQQLRTRSISTFEHLTEDEIEAGFELLAAAIAIDDGSVVAGESDLLVLGSIDSSSD